MSVRQLLLPTSLLLISIGLTSCGGGGSSSVSSDVAAVVNGTGDEQSSFTANPDCPDATQTELILNGGCPSESNSATADDLEGELGTFVVDCENTLPCISDTEDGKYRFCVWGVDPQLRSGSTVVSEIFTRFRAQPRAGLEGRETLILGTESMAVTNLNQRIPWSRNLGPGVPFLTPGVVEFEMPSQFFDANINISFGEVGYVFDFDFQYLDRMTLDISSNTGASYNPMFTNIPFELIVASDEREIACPSIEGL